MDIKALNEEYAQLLEACEKLTKDTEGKFTAEQQAEDDSRFARMDEIKSQIARHTKLAAAAFSAGATEAVEPKGKAEIIVGNAPAKFDKAEFSKALTQWGVSGSMAQKFATITTATQSNLFLPTEIAKPIAAQNVNAVREALAALGLKAMYTPGTNVEKVPVLDGSAGGVVAENASSETENVPVLTESLILTPETYQSGSVWFSNQSLAAVDYSLEDELLPSLYANKELGLEAAIMAALVADAGITQTVTEANPAAMDYETFVTLNRKLPKRYDRQKAIFLSRDGFAAAEKMVGTDGHPILVTDPQNSGLVRFAGTPVIRTDYLENFGSNKIVGIIVSFVAFRLRDCGTQQLARYTQTPSKPNQTGFNLFGYNAYDWAPSAVAKLKITAS